jgi:hypothetical protein
MKKKIESDLLKIQKVANATGMEGTIHLSYNGISLKEWDLLLASIEGFEMFKHFVSIAPKLTVTLILN